jgi:glycosyltransferase involved in cell wall biosynthesis
MRVAVSVTNDLATDQRVNKVCTTLAANGCEVVLIGRRLKSSPPVNRPYETKRMRLIFNRSALFYAEFNIRLFLLLLFTKADLFLSNDTDTLTACFLAAKLRRKQLVFDAHEMFPEVPEVTTRPFVKACWTRIEDLLFPKLRYCYTVCRSIADVYNKKYGIDMQVVRNIPPASRPTHSDQKPFDAQGRKVILYQGAVNVGRGLEWMIDAMPLLNGFVFVIAGDGDILNKLKASVAERHLSDRVIFAGRVPFEQLADYTACADIGVNLLENRGLNYYYSLPNRIFDFMRMGVPVLSTDFPEIRRVVQHYGTGVLINHYEPEYLAETIRNMAVQPVNPSRFETANRELTWENEAKTILQIIDNALNNK